LQQRLRRYSPKLAVVFFCAIAALIAEDPTSYLGPSVLRVGEKLACRCGGCRNTVGSCPMLHCEYSDPMRHRIAQMQGQNMSDSAIIASIVREEGVVALASPPAVGWGLFTWVMPAIALVLGFFVYSWWVKRNKQEPAPLTENDQAMIERFRAQIDREFGDEEKERVK
jgi:cytochrome c-type biogenesis protein CcmH